MNMTSKLDVKIAAAILSPVPTQPIIRVILCPNLSTIRPANGPINITCKMTKCN